MLREDIEQFLRETVLSKPPEERTQRDNQLLEHGRAFADVLIRHEQSGTAGKLEPHEQRVTELLKAQNAINREYDLRNVDADAVSIFRKGLK